MFCIFIVLWKAGLVTLGLLIIGEGLKYLVERQRQSFHEKVEHNRTKVHAQLLDTIKNAIMIFSTKMTNTETCALGILECSEDHTARTQDEKLRFARDLTCLPVALGTIVIPIVVYWELSGTNDPVRAFELGTAVLIVLLLGDEGHKSLLQLALLFDRELAAKEATTVLMDFLDEPHNDGAYQIEYTSYNGEDTDEENAISPPAVSKHSLNYRISMKGMQEITLRDVTLCYPGRNTPALKEVNISFQKGVIHG